MEPRLVGVGCSILLLCVATAIPAGATHVPGHSPDTVQVVDGLTLPETTHALQAGGGPPPVNPDSVHLRVAIRENGTAQWQIEYRTRLDDAETEAAFQQYQRDLQTDAGGDSEAFYDRMRATIATAENSTGREMSGTGFETRTNVRQLPQPYGVVTYGFQWHGFAIVNDDQINAGDALEGFFLNDDEQLQMTWPDGYELAEARPTPDERRDGAVTWTGPSSFGPGEPHVVATGVTGPLTPILGLAAAVVLAGLAAVLLWRRRRPGGVLPRPTLVLADDDEDDGRELLSNEEQVVDLLEARGGRVKQQEVAEELGWTKTKTSYVVSNLREEGRIHSFRLGRENVLSLSEPDEHGGGRA